MHINSLFVFVYLCKLVINLEQELQHFISKVCEKKFNFCFQIHKNIETVQKYMLAVNPALKKAFISVPTLHLTLMVMHLATPKDVEK